MLYSFSNLKCNLEGRKLHKLTASQIFSSILQGMWYAYQSDALHTFKIGYRNGYGLNDPVPTIHGWSHNAQYNGILRCGLWEEIKVRLVHEGGAPKVGLVSLQEEEERPELTYYPLPPCGDTVREWPSTRQEEVPHQELNLLPPWSWSSHPTELWELNFGCLSFLVDHILL